MSDEDEQMAEALVMLDDEVVKAIGGSVEQQFIAMELRVRRTLTESWLERAEDALSVVAKLSGDGLATFDEAVGVANDIHAAFEGWAGDVSPIIRATTKQCYKLAKRQIADRVNGKIGRIRPGVVRKDDGVIEASFELADEQAIQAIQRNQVYWIGEHYDEALATTIRDSVRLHMLERGLGRKEAGALLRQDLSHRLIEAPGVPHYFEGLAANVATTARVHGALRQMSDVGVEYYEIVNPIDERTCERCVYMDGRRFALSSGLRVADAVLAARTPEEARQAHPWATNLEQLQRAEKGGTLERDHPMPPFHFRCRCTTDTVEDVVGTDALESDV